MYDNAKMEVMLELSDKEFKAAIVKMLQWVIKNKIKANFKNRKSQQIKI